MGKMQINPTAVINAKKTMKVSCESISTNMTEFTNTYNSLYGKVKERIKAINLGLPTVLETFEKNVDYLSDIVTALEEATGYSEDELLNVTDEDFLEKKLYGYYFDKYYTGFLGIEKVGSEYIKYFISIDSNDDTYKKYQKGYDFISNHKDFFNEFDFERFNFDKYDMAFDLIYVRDKRGKETLEKLMDALLHDCPGNYETYNFNPVNIDDIIQDKSYMYRANIYKLDDYNYFSEKFDINGVEMEIAQIVPSDCTGAEWLFYNFVKAGTINSLKYLIHNKEFLAPTGNEDKEFNNIIVLACDLSATLSYELADQNVSGYCDMKYLQSETAQFPGLKVYGTVVLDVSDALDNFSYITKDALIHELAHRFDDMKGIHVQNNPDAWESLYEAYADALAALIPGSYDGKKGFEAGNNKYAEFFAEAMLAYILEPTKLKELCEELEKTMSNSPSPNLYEVIDSIMNNKGNN